MTGLVEQEPYLRIKKLFDEKKFDDIIEYCQKLLVKDPKNKLALQNISTAYNMVSGYQDAIQNADKILENDKTDEFALKNKMFAYEKLDRPNDVLKCCESILEKNKDDVDTLIGKGIALNKTENHEDAISTYKKVLALDVRNIDALMNLAITYKHLQKYQDAIRCYDMIQKITSKFSNIAIEKSKAFELLGNHDDAFLAAQGIGLDEAENIKNEAEIKNYSVQHAYELKRFYESFKLKNNDTN